MASKETQALIIEAIEYYIKSFTPEGACPNIEAMRKIVKLDDIKQSLGKATGE